MRWVPESRDPAPGALDALGVALSVGALGSLVWGIIEASDRGWTDGLVLGALGAGAVLGVLFVVRQRTAADPLLDVSLFRRPAFSVGSAAVSAVFFSLFGMFFLMTQYLQIVQGRSALETGVQMLPLAFGLVMGSALSHKVNLRVGAPRQVSTAMAVLAVLLASVAFWTPGTPWWVIALFFFFGPLAMGNVMAPASEAIMSAVPLAKAGVGSAMNDVNRMVAGALGVAVAGSIANSLFGAKMSGSAVAGLSEPAAHAAGESVGSAAAVSAELGGPRDDLRRVALERCPADVLLAFALLGGHAPRTPKRRLATKRYPTTARLMRRVRTLTGDSLLASS